MNVLKSYAMIDGTPIWQHLKENNSFDVNENITPIDNGKIAEIIGKRILAQKIFRDKTLVGSFYQDPNMYIYSLNKLNDGGDYTVQINYERAGKFGKKILLFEIKNRAFSIQQSQIQKYSSMILYPSNYFAKADEVKVVYMVFDVIDTVQQKVHYYFSVLEPTIAKKIIEQKDALEMIVVRQSPTPD